MFLHVKCPCFFFHGGDLLVLRVNVLLIADWSSQFSGLMRNCESFFISYYPAWLLWSHIYLTWTEGLKPSGSSLKLKHTRCASLRDTLSITPTAIMDDQSLFGKLVKRPCLGETYHLSLLSVSCFPEQLPWPGWQARLPRRALSLSSRCCGPRGKKGGRLGWEAVGELVGV